MSSFTETTRILLRLEKGEPEAVESLFPLVYEELRVLAQRLMARERPGHTLEPTAVVHEAYLRLVNASEVGWKGRSHFFRIAAKVIRQLLVDHARARATQKRGGSAD